MNIATFWNLLTVVAVLLLLLITGYLCRRKGLIDDVASKRLSSLIIYLGQPMLNIGALISKPYTPEGLKTGLTFMLIGFLLHPLMALLGLAASPLYRDRIERKINLFATIFTNCGFIGFPILEAIFPGEGAFIGAFFVIGYHTYLWTLGMAVLGYGREDIKLTPRKIFLNPGTIPCALGLGLYALQAKITLPAFIVEFTGVLGNICLPISVLIIGALLGKQGLGRVFRNPRLYLMNAVKLLAVPVAVAFIAKAVTLGMSDPYAIILFCTVIAGLPSASTVSMMAELYDIHPEHAASAVASTSVLSVATLPLVYFLGDLIARM